MSLAGKRVLVTRATEDQGPLEELLQRRGAHVFRMPCVAFEDLPGAGEALAAALAGAPPDFAAIASAHAAARLWALLPDAARALGSVQLAAAGPGTAQAIARLGRPDVLVPREGVGAEALVALLSLLVRGRTVLIPRAEGGNPALARGLEAAGARVVSVALYRTVAPEALDPVALDQLRRGAIDAVAFASGSAARNFARLAGTAVSAKVACMGRTCAAEARAAGLRVDVESDGGFPELCAALDRAI